MACFVNHLREKTNYGSKAPMLPLVIYRETNTWNQSSFCVMRHNIEMNTPLAIMPCCLNLICKSCIDSLVKSQREFRARFAQETKDLCHECDYEGECRGCFHPFRFQVFDTYENERLNTLAIKKNMLKLSMANLTKIEIPDIYEIIIKMVHLQKEAAAKKTETPLPSNNFFQALAQQTDDEDCPCSIFNTLKNMDIRIANLEMAAQEGLMNKDEIELKRMALWKELQELRLTRIDT